MGSKKARVFIKVLRNQKFPKAREKLKFSAVFEN